MASAARLEKCVDADDNKMGPVQEINRVSWYSRLGEVRHEPTNLLGVEVEDGASDL